MLGGRRVYLEQTDKKQGATIPFGFSSLLCKRFHCSLRDKTLRETI